MDVQMDVGHRCTVSCRLSSWPPPCNQGDRRSWGEIEALNGLVAGVAQPADIRREGIDLTPFRPPQQAQAVQDHPARAVEALVWQGVRDRHRAVGTDGIEEAAKQAAVGRFVEEMAEIGSDCQIVGRRGKMAGDTQFLRLVVSSSRSSANTGKQWRTWRDSNPRRPVPKFGGTGGGGLFASVRQQSSLGGVGHVSLLADRWRTVAKAAEYHFVSSNCGQSDCVSLRVAWEARGGRPKHCGSTTNRAAISSLGSRLPQLAGAADRGSWACSSFAVWPVRKASSPSATADGFMMGRRWELAGAT